jgi:hypothetical protein
LHLDVIPLPFTPQGMKYVNAMAVNRVSIEGLPTFNCRILRDKLAYYGLILNKILINTARIYFTVMRFTSNGRQK